MGTTAHEPTDAGGGAAALDFEELEALAQPPAQQIDPAALKLEGDAIPEPLRGKTLNDVLALQAEMQRGLEASRTQIESLRALNEARSQQPAPQAAPAQPAPEPEMTQAQLKEMYERDPFEYQQYMFSQMDKKIAKQVDSRVSPMAATTASAAEAQARAKFAEEFEVLGPEINQVLAQVPDRSALAQPGAWEQLMFYVRGQHMDKLLNARANKANERSLAEARQREAQNGGVVNDGSRRSGGRAAIGELSATQKEICQVMGISEADYRKYYI